jgi:hypothetical protein
MGSIPLSWWPVARNVNVAQAEALDKQGTSVYVCYSMPPGRSATPYFLLCTSPSIIQFLLLCPPHITPLSTSSPTSFTWLLVAVIQGTHNPTSSWIHFFPSFYISFCLALALCSGTWATLIPFTVVIIIFSVHSISLLSYESYLINM